MKIFTPFFAFFIVLSFFVSAQLTTNPQFPVASKKVTITFDSSKDSRLGYFTGTLYAHTGVKIKGNNDWKYVIGSWGNNTQQPKLTNKGNGIYEFEITPDIKTFYSVQNTDTVLQLAFVFRSADATKQTNDLFVDVFPEGLSVQISSQKNGAIIKKNTPITISAQSSVDAFLKLFVNDSLLAQKQGLLINSNFLFPKSGFNWIVAEATANNETTKDSVQIFVRDEVVLAQKPAEFRKGINYPTDTSAVLVLWAPLKEFVFVLGDFNNWTPDNRFQMKKDGDFFWLEIPHLTKNKEYGFQYFIDGQLKIADPYTEKIADPWNDTLIEPETYPDLYKYPTDKTEGVVSLLQPGQTDFIWQSTNFEIPDKNKLVIYELLVRDFSAQHSFKGVLDKLDYLDDLNINVLELMPVNEFEGNSSWGYNPSFYFAPDKYYGPKNNLKKLIDECHNRGIAVVIDMVLNHSYGQSPFVQMYMDNWTITPDNPWYNIQHNFQNPDAQWGFDFNHDSPATRELVDSIASFWMNEYRVDGFRFDFTKGFSNTVYGPSSWGSDYDSNRISNLKRMATQIWKRKPNALVILEHLAVNTEEKELADFGMLLWGNMHGAYLQAARGNIADSDLSSAVFSQRGWNNPNLVSYPESHDEERIMYELKRTGLSTSSYNIKNQQTALDRMELNFLFHILLPGPKMIWQFGERGYDQSINAFGGRLSEKPPYWNYLNNPNRTDLFKVVARVNYLKQTFSEFSAANFQYNLSGATKWFSYSDTNKVVGIGNFDINPQQITVSFPSNEKYYEYFSHDSVTISSSVQNIDLAPGEYRLYTTRKISGPGVATTNETLKTINNKLRIYPNPAVSEINVLAEKPFSSVQIVSLSGVQMVRKIFAPTKSQRIILNSFKPGIYLVQVISDGSISNKKIVVQ